jgi:hypothetical protein
MSFETGRRVATGACTAGAARVHAPGSGGAAGDLGNVVGVRQPCDGTGTLTGRPEKGRCNSFGCSITQAYRWAFWGRTKPASALTAALSHARWELPSFLRCVLEGLQMASEMGNRSHGHFGDRRSPRGH